MPFDTPFNLGPFTVDRTGRLSPQPDGSMPRFHLNWRGRAVHITFNRGLPAIRLAIALGRVPSSAGSLPSGRSAARDQAFATLRQLPACLPEGWQTELTADHRILLRTGTDIEMPVHVTEVLAKLVSFLIDVSPYLDLLDEDGLGVASAGAPAARPVGMAMS